MGDEFVRLNQAALKQISTEVSRSVGEACSLAEQIAVNNQVIQLMADPAASGELELGDLINEMYSGYLINQRKINLDIYALGYNGIQATTFQSNKYSLEDISADPRCRALLAGEQDELLLRTSYDPAGRGIFRYTYQILRVVRDHLTQQPCGLIILNVSENNLYVQYQNHLSRDASLCILAKDGTILSSKDKQQIGTPFDYNVEQLQKINRSAAAGDHIQRGRLYLSERIQGTDWYLAEKISSSVAFGPLDKLRGAIVVIICVCGAAMLVLIAAAARQTISPVMEIKDKMTQVTSGDLSARIEIKRKDEFGQIEVAFNQMVEQISALLNQVKREEREKRLAELDFLQAQINPHFIHNTLSSIRFMMEMEQYDKAGEMIYYFSRLLRQTLSRADEFVSLREELKTLDNYMKLQKLRYPDTFEVEYDVAEEVLDLNIPTLLLQPVVENAIFHGVGQHLIHIRITGRAENGCLSLIVADDGIGIPPDLRGQILHKDVQINRVGLRNVNDRIQLNYGQEYGIKITETEGGGATIRFSLPL